MALVESWKPDANQIFVASRVDRRSRRRRSYSGLLEELYFLQGILAVHRHALNDASAAFERVRSMDPENTRIDDFQHQVLLAGLTDPTLSPKTAAICSTAPRQSGQDGEKSQ